MATATYLALYDDFQQAQRVANALEKEGIQLDDVTVVSRTEAPDQYDQLRGYFDKPGEAVYDYEQEEKDNRWLDAAIVGAIIGAVPMGLSVIFESALFGGMVQTFLFMLVFGAAVGAALAMLMSGMAIFTRYRTAQTANIDEAVQEGLTILSVRDEDNYDAEQVQSIMRDFIPVEVTEADESAWLGTGWMTEKELADDKDNRGRNTIVDQRRRAFDWKEEGQAQASG